jgi:hypothetical protein
MFRRGKIEMSVACARSSNDLGWFSTDLVDFGADNDTSRSKTDLLRLEETDNLIQKIYKSNHLY